MGGEGVGRALDAVKLEIDAFGQPRLADVILEGAGAFGGSKLRGAVLGAGHAVGRHPRIKLKGAPYDRRAGFAEQG